MGLSKKIRFEVFKRDNFTCGYCGQTPPSVILEVDHIRPRAKQGKDDIDNLITACFDCNRGKRDRLLTEITPQLKDRLAEIKEREEQLTEYYKFLKKAENRSKNDIEEIDRYFWNLYDPETSFTDKVKLGTIKTFLKSLNKYEIMHAIDIAHGKIDDDWYNTYKYFCGICWNWIKKPETKAKKYGSKMVQDTRNTDAE